MSHLVRGELLKLRTTRTFLGLVLAALGLIAVIGGLNAALAPTEAGDRPGQDLLDMAGLTQPFALVLGILAVSTEFRHGTITPTLLATPDRARLMLAKLASHGLAGVVLGVVAYAVATVLVLTILPLRDIPSRIPLGDGVEMVAGGVVCVALLAALGVGIGALVRNQVGAIMAGLAWMFVVEPLLMAIPTVGEPIEKYGLNGSITAVSESTFGGGTDVGQVVGGLLLLGYAAVFAVVGAVAMRGRDVSA